MVPALRPGDIIVVRPARACDISPGKMVVYALKDEHVSLQRETRWDPRTASMVSGVSVNLFTVHRAVRCDRDALITRADNALKDDPPIHPSRIFGEVVAIHRGRSRLTPQERLTGAQKLCCFFLRRSILLAGIVSRAYRLRGALRHRLPSRKQIYDIEPCS
jgi:hypothetical protein